MLLVGLVIPGLGGGSGPRAGWKWRTGKLQLQDDLITLMPRNMSLESPEIKDDLMISYADDQVVRVPTILVWKGTKMPYTSLTLGNKI